MKFRYIIIISLISAILAIGAASASDDALTANCEIDNSTDEICTLNEEIEDNLTQNEENTLAISDEIDYEISDEVTLEEGMGPREEVVYFRSYDSSQTGALKVYVDNVLKYNGQVTSSSYHYDSDDGGYVYRLDLYYDDLGMTSFTTYTVKLEFGGQTLAQKMVKVTYPLTVEVYDYEYYSSDDFPIGETLIFNMYLPEDASDYLTLTVNGKSYPVDHKDGEGKISISTNGWSIGEYTATAEYYGDSKYPYDYAETTFHIAPKFVYPNVISRGEKESFAIISNSWTNGNAAIYRYYDDEYEGIFIANFRISNGYGSYSLSSLASGEYKFYVDYQIGNYHSRGYFNLVVKNNSPSFSSSITASQIAQGNSLTVKVKGPKTNSFVSFYLDDKELKSLSLSNGEINYIISGLTLGSHKIRVFFDVNNQFYSNTFHVTVKKSLSSSKSNSGNSKARLTLKAVKIKKSAKKLVLTATLKQGKKLLKGKKIIFKFNGKKYKAKTNKKGIAKVTVKKSVLKKLKVGKKVNYQANYGKITVKKSAKVKK